MNLSILSRINAFSSTISYSSIGIPAALTIIGMNSLSQLLWLAMTTPSPLNTRICAAVGIENNGSNRKKLEGIHCRFSTSIMAIVSSVGLMTLRSGVLPIIGCSALAIHTFFFHKFLHKTLQEMEYRLVEITNVNRQLDYKRRCDDYANQDHQTKWSSYLSGYENDVDNMEQFLSYTKQAVTDFNNWCHNTKLPNPHVTSILWGLKKISLIHHDGKNPPPTHITIEDPKGKIYDCLTSQMKGSRGDFYKLPKGFLFPDHLEEITIQQSLVDKSKKIYERALTVQVGKSTISTIEPPEQTNPLFLGEFQQSPLLLVTIPFSIFSSGTLYTIAACALTLQAIFATVTAYSTATAVTQLDRILNQKRAQLA